jgi:hypothetical protein
MAVWIVIYASLKKKRPIYIITRKPLQRGRNMNINDMQLGSANDQA